MDKIIDKTTLKKERRRRMIKIGVWAVAAVALAIVASNWIGGKSVRRSDIVTGAAERGPLTTAVAASGRVTPAYEEIIVSPVASRVVDTHVKAGDSVAAGTPLISLDLREVEAQCQTLRDNHAIRQNALRQLRLANRSALADLETQIRIKEMEVNRMAIEVENEQRLDSLGSGTGDLVRKARTALATGHLELDGLRQRLSNERERMAAAEAASALEAGNSARDLAMMEQTLSQGRVPAPRAGVITFINSDIGSTVAAGEKLAVVGDLSAFKIEAEVPEGSSYKVRPGAEAVVRLGNVELDGAVANVEPQSTSGAVPFTVVLNDASNPRLRPGVRVQVYVDYGFKDDVVRIPAGNYYDGPGEYFLFVADGSDRLERRRVTIGDSNREWVEVISGIDPGEEVVLTDMKQYEKNSSLKMK